MSDAYLDARQRLLTQLELEEGFWFTIVAGVDARPRERLRRVVRAWCDEHAVPFHDHALSPEQMREVAPSLARDPAPGVHWIREDVGAPQAATAGDFARLLLALNERRDAYVRGLKGALIVEGRASLRRQLQDLAPDLSSIAVPVPDLDRELVETEGGDDTERWWHLWPDANDRADEWLERTGRAIGPSGRYAALVHTSEALLSQGELSRAAPIVAEALGLARDIERAGAMPEALVQLRDRASVWAAALALEDGDAEVARAHLTATSAEVSDRVLSIARDVERANIHWVSGELGEALSGWDGVVQALLAGPRARIDAAVEGVHVLLERGSLAGDPEQAVAVWSEVMGTPDPLASFARSSFIQSKIWLRLERAVTRFATLDAAMSARLSGGLLRLADAAEAAGSDPYPWRALDAIGRALRLRSGGHGVDALDTLAGVEGPQADRSLKTPPLAILASLVIDATFADHAAFTAPGDALLGRVMRGLSRATVLAYDATLSRRARLATFCLALAGAHALEHAGRLGEAAELVELHILRRDDVPWRFLSGAGIARARFLHGLGRSTEAARDLLRIIPALERATRGRPLSAQSKHLLIYAWRDLGDCWSAAALRDEAANEGEGLDLARRAYSTATTIARRFQRQHPDDLDAIHELSVPLHPLATIAMIQGEVAEAERLTSEDLALSRRLVALDPRSQMLRLDLATTLLSVAELRARRGDAEGWADALFEARTLAAAALRDDPEDARARRLLSAAGGDAPLTTAAAPPTPR